MNKNNNKIKTTKQKAQAAVIFLTFYVIILVLWNEHFKICWLTFKDKSDLLPVSQDASAVLVRIIDKAWKKHLQLEERK